jgi:hypothetical protein
MTDKERILFLERNGFEVRPGAGRRCYPYLVIDHNRNSEEMYFANVEQAYAVITRWYLPNTAAPATF